MMMMSPLHLLFIGDPASTFVQRWLQYFVEQGHFVHLVPYPDSFIFVSDRVLDGVRIHKIHSTQLRKWDGFYKKYLIIKNIFLCQKILKQYPIDIVHAHYISACGWIGSFLNFHPFILTAWGSDVNIDPDRSFFYRFLAKRAIRTADLITANSHDLIQKLVTMGANPEEAHHIQAGLEIERFPFQRGNDRLRQDLGLKDELIVLSTRSLSQVYNLDILVRAIPLVKREIPNVKFIFIYRGTSEQENNLRRLIKNENAMDSVILVGSVDNFHIAEYYQLADIFISITSSEGMPISLTEAMACGAVPVVSDLPVFRDWIKPNINGLIVQVRNVEITANAIVTLFKNPVMRDSISRVNRKLVVDKFDYRIWMQKVEDFYYKLSSDHFFLI
jgi:glycosyltransferase involved in cell wall biosynthesis